MCKNLGSDLNRVATRFWRGLGSDVANSCAAMYKRGDFIGLAKLSVSPRSYTSPLKYLIDVAAVSLLRKAEDLPIDADQTAAAKQTFFEGEAECKRANQRLAPYRPDYQDFFTEDLRDPEIGAFISDVREIIVDWIGATPPRLENLEVRFGPGATYSHRATHCSVAHKMQDVPCYTRQASVVLDSWSKTQWGRYVLSELGGEVSEVRGNIFSTAPKTALVFRPIAKSAEINSSYQLATGRELRNRLLRNADWDLTSAAEIHKQVACEASLSRAKATLDFTNASGTVCKNLVRSCVPPVWFFLLDSLREPMTRIDGKWHLLEQFSSMGNGYTFELETILIGAIACAYARKRGRTGRLGVDVFVFGDDLIVDDDLAEPLQPIYKFFGLTFNREKSYWGQDNPFRESCGGDFFNGVPVRPFFLKEFPSEPADYIAFANGLTRLNQNIALAGGIPDLGAWFAVLDCLPANIRRLRGPQGLGDLVVHDADQSKWQIRKRSSIRYIGVWRPFRTRIHRFDRFHPKIVLACLTYGTGVSSPLGRCRRLPAMPEQGSDRTPFGLVPRNAVTSYKVGWVAWS